MQLLTPIHRASMSKAPNKNSPDRSHWPDHKPPRSKIYIEKQPSDTMSPKNNLRASENLPPVTKCSACGHGLFDYVAAFPKHALLSLA